MATNGLYYAYPLILASGSHARRQLLEQAKLVFDVVPCHIEENDIKRAIRAECPKISPGEMAEKLALAKAQAVSGAHVDKLAIGGDQVCEIDGEALSKAETREEALSVLKNMRGRTHYLHSSVAVALNDRALWKYTETAALRMLPLKDSVLEAYVDAERPFSSVGCYFFESMGRHLFAEVDGSTECVMGMPLNPLICALHDLGLVEYRG
ncbi:MAG: nucleoside triphosphate pyrophosphatase [Rickettsiales bacterium]